MYQPILSAHIQQKAAEMIALQCEIGPRRFDERKMEHFKGQSTDFNHNRATESACVTCLHVGGVQKGLKGPN